MSKICPKCGKSHEKPGTYCSRSCANSVASRAARNKQVLRNCQKCGSPTLVKARTSKSKVVCDECAKTMYVFKNNRRYYRKVYKACPICGSVKGACPEPDICKHRRFIRQTLCKYFQLDRSTLGSLQIYTEWYRIKEKLHDLYLIQQKNSRLLCEMFNFPDSGGLIHVFSKFGIRSKTKSQGLRDFIYTEGLVDTGDPKYSNGFHISWDGRKIYYRSSYELNYMKKLDLLFVEYEQTVRLRYWDSQLDCERVAIPDFYLPSQNKLVEIKSNWTYDPQNMADKEQAYRKAGYEFELRLEKDLVDPQGLKP